MNLRLLEQSSAFRSVLNMESNVQTPLLKSISASASGFILPLPFFLMGRTWARSDGDREYFSQMLDGQKYWSASTAGQDFGQTALLILAKPDKRAGDD